MEQNLSIELPTKKLTCDNFMNLLKEKPNPNFLKQYILRDITLDEFCHVLYEYNIETFYNIELYKTIKKELQLQEEKKKQDKIKKQKIQYDEFNKLIEARLAKKISENLELYKF
jgi:hypothetical protein